MSKMGERTLARAAQMTRWIAGPNRSIGRKADEYLDMREREVAVPAALRGSAICAISPQPVSCGRCISDHGDYDPHAFLYSDNGMRTDHVAALQKVREPGDPVRFGFVGSLVWYKGGETLVRAMQELRGANAELNVYGTFDPENDEHHRELEALAAGAAVTFHGRFDNSKLAEVYAQIDVLIVPSVWFENSPITIHEAHLTRTPVLASNIGGMAEYVRDGIDGLHFEVGSSTDLARVMRRFLDEPGLLDELSQNFPPLKTLEENVAETQFRYRALACVERATAETSAPLSWRGMQHIQAGGAVDQQGVDYALLRPGAWVEFDVPVRRAGRLVVDLFFLQEEPDLEQSGRVWVGGHPVASLLPRRGSGVTETFRIELDVAPLSVPSTDRVRVDTLHYSGGPSGTLRIEQITWQARG